MAADVAENAALTGGMSNAAAGRRLRSIVGWAQRNGLFFALVLLVAFFATRSERYLTTTNLHIVFLQVAVVGIIAVPGAMLIMAGYVDLAIGSIAVLAGVVLGELVTIGWSALPAAVAGAPGWTRLGSVDRIPRRLPRVLAGGGDPWRIGGRARRRGDPQQGVHQVRVWPGVSRGLAMANSWASTRRSGSSPRSSWAAPTRGIRRRSAAIRIAIGAERNAAHSLGVATKRIPFLLYGASGLAAALGGLIVTSQLDASSLSIGINLELSVLSAILLGGVSFTGGRGSLFGVLLGVLFIGALDNGLIQMNVGPYFQRAAVGLALVLAAALDVLYQRLDRIPVPETTGSEVTSAVQSAASDD